MSGAWGDDDELDLGDWEVETSAPHWTQVISKKRQAPKPKKKRGKTNGNWRPRKDDPINCGHEECQEAGTGYCTIAIRKTIACRHEAALRGSCPYGDECYFSHGDPTSDVGPIKVAAPTPSCIFESRKRGSCRNGSACAYRH